MSDTCRDIWVTLAFIVMAVLFLAFIVYASNTYQKETTKRVALLRGSKNPIGISCVLRLNTVPKSVCKKFYDDYLRGGSGGELVDD